MLQIERQEKILELIVKAGKISTKDLQKQLQVSLVTIRTDLKALENRGVILRVHGGAVSVSDRLNIEIPSTNKEKLNRNAKQTIAKLAEQIIMENDVIILDSGTTTLEIAKLIKDKTLTVITNDIKIAMTLALNKNIDLVVTGGRITNNLYTVSGIQSINFFNGIRADKLFLGCDAIDFKTGISDRSLDEVAVKQAMIGASSLIIALADSSKHHKTVFAKVSKIEDMDIIITERISQGDKQSLNEKGLQVITANLS